MLNLFIGYDSREPIAYHVAAHSVMMRASRPLSITPVALHQLGGLYWRERGPTESTEFSLTRFLVPYLSQYQGTSIFMDCDFLAQVDLYEVAYECRPGKAVWVCQHDYTPKTESKMGGLAQTIYPRKNWSSFMMFDNARCRVLTPAYVSTALASDLQRFKWVRDEEIGALPLEWNWLVGEYPLNPLAKMLHYTLGGPWFAQYRRGDHTKEWLAEYRTMVGQDFAPQQVWECPPLPTLVTP